MGEMTPASKPVINICVVTYKRPELLKKLLVSLFAQQTADAFRFSVIVVDNDYRRSAQTVVQKFSVRGFPAIYDVEPEQNISLARNKALSHADGDFIATIDDDEYADEHWLWHLYHALTAYNADIVHGPVFSKFAPGTRHFIRTAQVFNRPNPQTGLAEIYFYVTGSSLFRSHLIAHMTSPFEAVYGQTGGEDWAFFHRLKKCGARMIWCRESKAYEVVPAARANPYWIFRRQIRHGNQHPFMRRDRNFSRPRLLARHLYSLSISLCSFFWHATQSCAQSKKRTKAALQKKAMSEFESMAFSLGVLSYFLHFRSRQYRG